MRYKIHGKIKQLNVRFTEEDHKLLARCQKIMGGLSQVDTIRQLLLMFLGKIPSFPQQKRIGVRKK